MNKTRRLLYDKGPGSLLRPVKGKASYVALSSVPQAVIGSEAGGALGEFRTC